MNTIIDIIYDIAGNYGISIKFGGVPIPEGDYDVEVRRL